jgi:hypothetical protein
MRSLCKIVVAALFFAVASATPVMAQIDNGMDFTTTFPFYAQNANCRRDRTRSLRLTLTAANYSFRVVMANMQCS